MALVAGMGGISAACSNTAGVFQIKGWTDELGPDITPFFGALVLLAGFGAGFVNTIVGSGTLITFPTLLAMGYPPVVANVTNSAGLWPGSVSGAVGYRRELRGQGRRTATLGLCTVLGACGGGVLLLSSPPGIFSALVPWLILTASVLMAAQPWLSKHVLKEQRGRRSAVMLAVLLTGVYGGYFGAAQGVILISLLCMGVSDHIQRLNALKNALTAVANVVAAIIFSLVAHVVWVAALLIAAGSIAGSQCGALVGRRIPAATLRWIVVVAGCCVAGFLFLDG